MRSVWLGSLRTHTRRYVSAALAVAVGVAFVVVTAALASSTRSGLAAGIDAPYRHADAVVKRPDVDTAAALVETHDASPVGWTDQPVRRGDRVLANHVEIGVSPTEPAWQWQDLTAGRFPVGPGEALVDTNAAKAKHVALGDRLRLGTGEQRLDVTVVGLAKAPTQLAQATVYVIWPDLLTWRDQVFLTSIGVAGDTAGIDHAQPVDTYLTDVRTELDRQVDVVALVLLLFAAIALFVSVLVIANTFSILFAQRMRDFALLRCVGATRRQVARSVRLEAITIGTLASLLGLVAGFGLGDGIVRLIGALSDNAPLGPVDIGLGWIVGAFVIGLVVTLVASWLPTRRVLTVTPMAALRPHEDVEPRTGAGRLRLALGLLLVLGGVALLTMSVAARNTLVMVAGGGAAFTGVLLLGPVLMPALVRAAGSLLGRFAGPEARLASANAVRNPRRTAATAASLLVGVTLTTAVLTGMATARDAITDAGDTDHPVDLTLTSTTPLPGDVASRAGAVPGVAEAVGLAGTRAQVAGRDVVLLAAPASHDVLRSTAFVPGPGEITLPADVADAVPDTVTVTVGGHRADLRVVTASSFSQGALVTQQTLADLSDHPETYAVWVRADDGADPDDLGGDLGALAPDADLENGLADRAWVDLQLDIFTGAVVGLLAISVLIALVGIANTLGLSVLERSREHALLRALGLTRRGLRRMLAAEAVLLSVVATVLGTAIGVAFAWVGVRVMVAQAFDDVPMVLPLGQLALVVLIAAGAGLVSCLLPARRAARVAPAQGLALD
ncbi:putative ABC transport system permease protein [Nocardioides terrae]|uniref:Putative ABC transport system permease protein n=1 Tax=Nocardioides terrae TaxID=574651 RepID=A0A1I1GXJ7_9ACTN|nr:FtsX-like permease family protein [Nocardioides terrae]SFC16235.1 putative ABC transport system permease protein [Nocardioides terrae]